MVSTSTTGVTTVSASAGGAETAPGSGEVVWNLADVGPGSVSGTVSLVVEVDGEVPGEDGWPDPRDRPQRQPVERAHVLV